MSSATELADIPSEISATESVLEEFEMSISDVTIEILADHITEIGGGLRSNVTSDDRLEEPLRGQLGLDILHSTDPTEHSDPQPEA